MTNRIKSFDGIRVIAFIGVILSHLSSRTNIPYDAGVAGVSVFIILSGFLMAYNHEVEWENSSKNVVGGG